MRGDVDWEAGLNWSQLRRYRLERMVQAMQHDGLDAVLFTKLDAIRYLTSFRPVYSMWFHGTRYVVIVTAAGHVAFLVASGDYERVRTTMPWLEDVTPFPFVMADGVPLVKAALERLGLGRARVGSDLLPVGFQRRLQEALPEVQLTDGLPALEDARRIKHPIEIDLLREAAGLADRGMKAALDAVKEGATEMEVSAAAAQAIMLGGSEDVPYYPLVEAGPHSWTGYRFPTLRPMRTGEMVYIDCGACIYNGYNGDIARMTVVGGQGTAEQRRIYAATYEMLHAAIRLARAGVETAAMVGTVMDVARRAGYEEQTYFGILGHGIGTDLHEAPSIGERVGEGGRSEILEANMVIAVEPGILVPGVGGGHLEDMILITDDGAHVLTKTPFQADLL